MNATELPRNNPHSRECPFCAPRALRASVVWENSAALRANILRNNLVAWAVRAVVGGLGVWWVALLWLHFTTEKQ